MTADVIPPWLYIIRDFGRSPTLPLLIGALREYTAHLDGAADDYSQVLSLFNEMSTYTIPNENGRVVYLRRCKQLGVPVFSIESIASLRIYESKTGAIFPPRSQSKARLCFSGSINDFGRSSSLEEAVELLFYGDKHSWAIEQHRYSWNKRANDWEPFDPDEDCPRIVSALRRAGLHT